MKYPKIEGPLNLEIKRGYKNDAVIGGLDKFILKVISEIEIDKGKRHEIIKIFEAYDKLSEIERAEKVKSVLKILNEELVTANEKASRNEIKQESVSITQLFIPVQYVKGVGPKLSKVLKKLEIETAYDLIYYFPRDYIDLRNISKIGTIHSGERVTLKVEILNISERRARLNIITVLCTDGTGYITAIWFNQPYIKNVLKEGDKVILSGKVQYSYGKWEMPSPDYEILHEGKETIHSLRIIPIYSLTQRITQKMLRNKIKAALDNFATNVYDYLDETIRKKYEFLTLPEALANIHFPDDFRTLKKAKERLIFDELFELQFLLGIRRKEIKELPGIELKVTDEDIKEFKSLLPFELTNDQQNAISEIVSDFTSGKPMNRLLHGDVGSGKTVVALFAIFIAAKNGYQSAMMSPTEILAQQTFKVAQNILSKSNLNVALLTSGTSIKARKLILEEIKNGNINALFGTHALIEEDVTFNNLGMIVVDEQHRFGVLQRGRLRKKGAYPHTLVMSATPIPRTLALTLYGDLDITQIREMPAGRKPVTTKVFFETDYDAYSLLINELNEGRKGYVVCPLIEDSEVTELQSVERKIEELRNSYLKNFNLGMLHGGMSSEEKRKMMEDFRNGKVQVLVSTTVVEVGVDVPDASVIIIEDADRFGLATLHQLRGRVGRSDLQSYCFLITRNAGGDVITRLRVLEKTNNGFEVSEEDLKLRGPGEILGTKQSGIPEFKLTTLLSETDLKLLEIAREEALALIGNEVKWNREHKKELINILKSKSREKISLIEVA